MISLAGVDTLILRYLRWEGSDIKASIIDTFGPDTASRFGSYLTKLARSERLTEVEMNDVRSRDEILRSEEESFGENVKFIVDLLIEQAEEKWQTDNKATLVDTVSWFMGINGSGYPPLTWPDGNWRYQTKATSQDHKVGWTKNVASQVKRFVVRSKKSKGKGSGK